jgi:deoxyribodipyrimidine photo-lyase
VDDRAAVKWAKDQLYPLRKTPQAREEADAIQQRHGSRKSGLQPSGTRAKARRATPAPQHPGQADLFGFGADA